MGIIFIIVVAVLAINVLVLTHELGHFLVAKRCGMIVERFSIGFGPRVFGFTWRGTEYRLSWVLFGGYVKFHGDEVEPDQEPDRAPGSFFGTNPWNRILVCMAGGVCNIFLAWVLYTVIFFSGIPVTVDSLNTVIGEIQPDSAAEAIGLKPDDRIVKINDKELTSWEDLVYAIALNEKKDLHLEVERQGKVFVVDTSLKPDPKTGLRRLGIMPKDTIIVGDILKDSPAEKAGLRKEDQIVGINGQKVFCIHNLIEKIQESEGQEVILTVIRDGERLFITGIPEKLEGHEQPALGFMLTTNWTKIYPRPGEQFKKDILRTWRILKGLFARRLPVKALSGPVGIIRIIGISALIGWGTFLGMMALISLNLGIINLLPIPVLDGGHIVFTIIEAIRKKPLSIKIITKIQNVFMYLLIAFMVYVSYHDVLRFMGK